MMSYKESTMHYQHMTANGSIHYWVSYNKNPNAKCIVFTHGMATDHTMFEAELDYFSKDYSIIVWDMPLHGWSLNYEAFSYREVVMGLHGILKQEEIKQVVLVGMSMGGHPSQMFASMYPEMVEGFIAMDTLPLGKQYYKKSTLRMLKPITWIMKCLPEKVLKREMAKSISHSKDSYDKTVEMIEPLTKKQMIEQICAVFDSFIKENTDITLQCPVLILVGAYDNIAGIQGTCKKWAENIGCQIHIIEHAGHFSNGDNPTGVRLEIERFLISI